MDVGAARMSTPAAVAWSSLKEQPSLCVQMLDEAGYAREGRIAVTQPRRVVSLALSLSRCNAANVLLLCCSS